MLAPAENTTNILLGTGDDQFSTSHLLRLTDNSEEVLLGVAAVASRPLPAWLDFIFLLSF